MADVQVGGDLVVGQAAGYQDQYLVFASGDVVELAWGRGGLEARGELLDEPAGDGRCDQGVPRGAMRTSRCRLSKLLRAKDVSQPVRLVLPPTFI
ncbi:hypothetical protein AB0M80_34790 [Amycolatopsis sp. NPDC051045]|uniref:hypothetical protein n=1 Tax=Amycolatopsis sp. NPDC051045 TaxID=3156922 RepID=UPI00342632EF